MKKIILILSLCVSGILFSQEKPTEEIKIKKSLNERKHEVKIGAIKLLSGPIFEGTYENIHSKDFTYGGSILVNLSNSENDYPEDFSITPFVRFYFQESKEYGAYGFFVEGFGKFISGQYEPLLFDSEDKEKYTAASIGISLGKKWVNNSGFVFELLVGAGRNIGNADNAPDASFRGDLNIGYRF